MRRWSSLVSLFAVAALATPAPSAVERMSGDPPPDLAALLAAERRFCARAAQTSIRDAFFEALDETGVVFRPGPVNGREFFRDRPSNPGPILHWEPTYAEISQAGDLGWTTGPWDYTAKGDHKPSAFGTFATVWRIGTDRKWHVLVDLGPSHKPVPAESLSFARVGGPKRPDRDWSLRVLTGSVNDLGRADSAYTSALGHDGLAAALAQWGDVDVRVYRDELAPIVGAAAAGKALAHEWDRGVVAWNMQPGGIASSSDLGFLYGTVDLPPGKKDEPTRRNVVHVWRRSPGEGWKLALDVTLPAPPDAPAPSPPPGTQGASH